MSSSQQQSSVQIPHKPPQWREAVAGAAAGAMSRTVMAPVERVKLILQLQGSLSTASSSSSSASRLTAWSAARKVHQEQGVLAFWRGNFPNVVRVSGTAAINFTCMEYYKRVVVGPVVERTTRMKWLPTAKYPPEELQRRQNAATSFLSGGLAGATSTTVLYPIEFARTRLAMDMGGSTQTRQYTGMRHVFISILRSDGVLGFFQGYGIALAGGVVYRILLLGGYDALKNDILWRKKNNNNNKHNSNNTTPHKQGDRQQQQQQGHDLSWSERILSAQGISLAAGTISYPFDSVRRRLMMQAGQPKSERLYKNSIHCIEQVWKQEGIRGFYLGLGPNIVRSIGGALLLVGYDSVKSILAAKT